MNTLLNSRPPPWDRWRGQNGTRESYPPKWIKVAVDQPSSSRKALNRNRSRAPPVGNAELIMLSDKLQAIGSDQLDGIGGNSLETQDGCVKWYLIITSKQSDHKMYDCYQYPCLLRHCRITRKKRMLKCCYHIHSASVRRVGDSSAPLAELMVRVPLFHLMAKGLVFTYANLQLEDFELAPPA
jgi:hypothetical protein